MRTTMGRRAYPSESLRRAVGLIGALDPPTIHRRRRPAEIERREIINGILYVLRSGCRL